MTSTAVNKNWPAAACVEFLETFQADEGIQQATFDPNSFGIRNDLPNYVFDRLFLRSSTNATTSGSSSVGVSMAVSKSPDPRGRCYTACS
jgi:hypothetical protein